MNSQSHTQDQDAVDGVTRRDEFQEFLDKQFPIGAMCAVIVADSLLESASPIATGRLLCSGVEVGETGRAWYELVIDGRGDLDGESEVITLWASAPRQHRSNSNLWESDLRSRESSHSILRLNADPPERWRPTPTMRKAVTDAYANRWTATAGIR